MADFPALTGFYRALFLYVEPVSVILPALFTWGWPGVAWFHAELIPLTKPGPLDANTRMAVWQLVNCYVLLAFIGSFVFRAARDALPKDLAAQERIVGALLTAYAIADITHIIVSLVGLPEDIRFNPVVWNGTTHGNNTITAVLFASRMAWFLGIGRKTYWYATEKVKTA